jgi:hypothetical protein
MTTLLLPIVNGSDPAWTPSIQNVNPLAVQSIR